MSYTSNRNYGAGRIYSVPHYNVNSRNAGKTGRSEASRTSNTDKSTDSSLNMSAATDGKAASSVSKVTSPQSSGIKAADDNHNMMPGNNSASPQTPGRMPGSGTNNIPQTPGMAPGSGTNNMPQSPGMAPGWGTNNMPQSPDMTPGSGTNNMPQTPGMRPGNRPAPSGMTAPRNNSPATPPPSNRSGIHIPGTPPANVTVPNQSPAPGMMPGYYPNGLPDSMPETIPWNMPGMTPGSVPDGMNNTAPTPMPNGQNAPGESNPGANGVQLNPNELGFHYFIGSMLPEQNPYKVPMGIPLIPLYGYDSCDELDKDAAYIKQLYPSQVKIILPYVEGECDRMEYDGSVMFDEYPDKVILEKITDRIYENVKDLDDEPQLEAKSIYFYPQRRSSSNLRDVITLLLLNEIFNRRRRYRSRKRWF